MLIRSRIANVTHSTNRIYLYLSKDWAYSSSSGIRFQVSLEVLPFVFPFRFVSCYCPRVHKNPTNKYHYPRTILAFAFSFQIRFVDFVSVVESCCWFSVFNRPLQFVCFRCYPIHLYPNNKSIHPFTRFALASRLACTLATPALR